MKSIAIIYAKRCERKELPLNFNEVPKELKDDVKEIIKADGYKIEKSGTVSKVEE